MTKNQMHEVTNPHDKIFIDCSDVDAARLAVLVVGEGKYGIKEHLPILGFAFGLGDDYFQDAYGQTFEEWASAISAERIVKALESMVLDGERTSLADPVEKAHAMARHIRKVEGLGAKDE